jgi:hypothetical protein
MNLHNNYSYNGCVQIIQTLNGSTTIDKHYNNGTNILFEAYSRALTGLNIRDFVPKYITLSLGDTKISHTSIPVIVTYKEPNTDGGKYGVPYTRVTAVVLNSMVSTDASTDNDTVTLKLYSSISDTELASVDVTGLYGILQGITSGVQVSIMWDLYVSNPISDGGNE